MSKFGFNINRLLPSVLIRILPMAIIVLVIIGYVADQIINKTILDTHQSRLEQIADQSSTAVALRLQSIIDTASILAANDLVINSIIDVEDRDRYIPTLFRSITVLGSTSVSVSLTDYRGRQIASNADGRDYRDASWVDQVMDGKRLISIRPDGMLIAVPISISNLPEGIIAIEFDESELKDALNLPVQADAYSVETITGDVIFSSNTDFSELTITNHQHTLAADWIAAEADIEGFVNLRLFAGDTIAGVLEPVQSQIFFLTLAFIASLIAVTFGIIATALMTLRPLTRFMKGVSQVGSSTDLKFRMEPAKIDEFQKLTTNFNVMLSNLEATTSSRDYVDSILNSMNEFMLVTSPEGFIESGNLAISRFLLCNISDLTGRNATEFISSEWQELVNLAESNNLSIESTLTNSTGRKIPVLISASHLNASQVDPEKFIVVLKDITEQTEARKLLDKHVDELSRSNSDLEQFAYVASHDLKAPLRSIDNLAQWIEEDSADQMSDESRKDMSLLRGRVKRLDTLLAGLLQYAKTGKGKTEVTQCDTQILVQDVVDLLGATSLFEIIISDSLPEIVTNRVPLEQVFQNLINNAIKHHDRDSGKIEISSRDLGEFVQFSIKDDGPGISKEYHEKVFQMFQTLKRRDELDSNGLGLAVVRKLVVAHGGKIDVVSTENLPGVTFRFTWPKNIVRGGT